MNREVDTCRERLVEFCYGCGLDLGFGGKPITPWSICIDREIFNNSNIEGDIEWLPWFNDNAFDYVFSSHALEDFENTNAVLTEWLRVIKPGGYLVLFLPDQKRYISHCSAHKVEPNKDHKHDDFSLLYVLEKMPKNTKVIRSLDPVPNNFYSFDLVVKKV